VDAIPAAIPVEPAPPTLQQQMRDFTPLVLDPSIQPIADEAGTTLLLIGVIIAFACTVGLL
jgi:hypothetical protein